MGFCNLVKVYHHSRVIFCWFQIGKNTKKADNPQQIVCFFYSFKS